MSHDFPWRVHRTKLRRGEIAIFNRSHYEDVLEDALSKCSTESTPWFVVPANHKWYRNVVVARIVVETLEGLDLRYPAPTPGLAQVVIED